jgi:hypothetical protein
MQLFSNQCTYIVDSYIFLPQCHFQIIQFFFECSSQVVARSTFSQNLSNNSLHGSFIICGFFKYRAIHSSPSLEQLLRTEYVACWLSQRMLLKILLCLFIWNYAIRFDRNDQYVSLP